MVKNFTDYLEGKMGEISHGGRVTIIPNNVRINIKKHFGFYSIDGKIVVEGKAVCCFLKKMLPYKLPYRAITTTTNLKSPVFSLT